MPASSEDVQGELAPLFGQLDAVGERAREIERDALAEAQQRRARAQAQAATILEQAGRRAEEERARAGREQRAEVEQEARELHERSAQEAARIRAVRTDRVEELLAEVMACVRRGAR